MPSLAGTLRKIRQYVPGLRVDNARRAFREYLYQTPDGQIAVRMEYACRTSLASRDEVKMTKTRLPYSIRIWDNGHSSGRFRARVFRPLKSTGDFNFQAIGAYVNGAKSTVAAFEQAKSERKKYEHERMARKSRMISALRPIEKRKSRAKKYGDHGFTISVETDFVHDNDETKYVYQIRLQHPNLGLAELEKIVNLFEKLTGTGK